MINLLFILALGVGCTKRGSLLSWEYDEFYSLRQHYLLFYLKRFLALERHIFFAERFEDMNTDLLPLTHR